MNRRKPGRSAGRRRVLILAENWPVPPDRRVLDGSRELALARGGKGPDLHRDPARREAVAREGRRRIEGWLCWDHRQAASLRIYDDLLGRRRRLAPAAALPRGRG